MGTDIIAIALLSSNRICNWNCNLTEYISQQWHHNDPTGAPIISVASSTHHILSGQVCAYASSSFNESQQGRKMCRGARPHRIRDVVKMDTFHRCVTHHAEFGCSESNSMAICRHSLGLGMVYPIKTFHFPSLVIMQNLVILCYTVQVYVESSPKIRASAASPQDEAWSPP